MVNDTARYRMFVDEVGHAGMGRIQHENDRYLSLTGIIVEQAVIQHALIPQIEDLKERHFGRNNDGSAIVLHRKELLNRKPPFQVLKDPFRSAHFDHELLQIIEAVDYKIVTVVLDKQEHITRYKEWRHHPYNYCVEILAERFVLLLEEADATGDIVAEARGRVDDEYLRNAVGYVLRNGNAYVGRERFSARISPGELRVHPKSANIAGLQLADLLAHPSFVATKLRRQNKALPDNFGGMIAGILETSKYRRGQRGIAGYGRKWLP